MDSLINLIASFGPWNWLFLAIVLMALEFVVPGVHFLWFGLAAAIVGGIVMALAAVGGGEAFTWPLQLILFTLIAVATVFLVKRASRPFEGHSDAPDLNVRGAQYVGRVVTVEDAIVNGRGKVRVGDTVWSAQGPDTPRGTQVKVTGVNGTVLIVSVQSA